MLVLGWGHSDSVIPIHGSILFQIPFPFKMLHNIEQSSLGYTVGPSFLCPFLSFYDYNIPQWERPLVQKTRSMKEGSVFSVKWDLDMEISFRSQRKLSFLILLPRLLGLQVHDIKWWPQYHDGGVGATTGGGVRAGRSQRAVTPSLECKAAR